MKAGFARPAFAGDTPLQMPSLRRTMRCVRWGNGGRFRSSRNGWQRCRSKASMPATRYSPKAPRPVSFWFLKRHGEHQQSGTEIARVAAPGAVLGELWRCSTCHTPPMCMRSSHRNSMLPTRRNCWAIRRRFCLLRSVLAQRVVGANLVLLELKQQIRAGAPPSLLDDRHDRRHTLMRNRSKPPPRRRRDDGISVSGKSSCRGRLAAHLRKRDNISPNNGGRRRTQHEDHPRRAEQPGQ